MSVWFVDMLILIAWVSMRFVDVVGCGAASVKVMLSFLYKYASTRFGCSVLSDG